MPSLTLGSPITNADTGIVETWVAGFGGYCAYEDTPYGFQSTVNQPFIQVGCVSQSKVNQLTPIGGGGSSVQTAQMLQPVLQRADGTFVGYGMTDRSMVAFNTSGNILWSVPNYSPVIATADGGVVAQAYNGFGFTASTFDADGKANGQIGNLPVYSWLGDGYQLGSVDQISSAPIAYAPTFGAIVGGNNSANGTAIQQVQTNQDQGNDHQLPPQARRWIQITIP